MVAAGQRPTPGRARVRRPRSRPSAPGRSQMASQRLVASQARPPLVGRPKDPRHQPEPGGMTVVAGGYGAGGGCRDHCHDAPAPAVQDRGEPTGGGAQRDDPSGDGLRAPARPRPAGRCPTAGPARWGGRSGPPHRAPAGTERLDQPTTAERRRTFNAHGHQPAPVGRRGTSCRGRIATPPRAPDLSCHGRSRPTPRKRDGYRHTARPTGRAGRPHPPARRCAPE